MQIAKKIFEIFFLYFVSSSIVQSGNDFHLIPVQYIEPQKEKLQKSEGEGIVTLFAMIDSPLRLYELQQKKCNEHFKESNHARELFNRISNAKQDLNMCHIKKTGSPITTEMVKNNNNTSSLGIFSGFVESTLLNDGKGVNPYSRKDVKMCNELGDIFTPVITILNAANYTTPGWCERFK